MPHEPTLTASEVAAVLADCFAEDLQLPKDVSWTDAALRSFCESGGLSLPPAMPSAMHGPPLVVSATDGLCNRLRVVLSFAMVARRARRPLIVVWCVSSVCPGRFQDAFEPMAGVTFTDAAPDGVRAAFPPFSHDFHPEIKGSPLETRCYEALRPLPAVAAVAADVLRECGGRAAAMHVRRTDHWGSAVTDEEFAAWATQRPAATRTYLATDNAGTQARLRQLCGDRVHARSITADPTALRQTSLVDAAVDLFVCAAAAGPFKGTPSSSFSDTILRLRVVRGTASPEDEHAFSDARTQMLVTAHSPGGHLSHAVTL